MSRYQGVQNQSSRFWESVTPVLGLQRSWCCSGWEYCPSTLLVVMENSESPQVCYHYLHHDYRYARRSCWCDCQGVIEVRGVADQDAEVGEGACDQGMMMRGIVENKTGREVGEIADDLSWNGRLGGSHIYVWNWVWS